MNNNYVKKNGDQRAIQGSVGVVPKIGSGSVEIKKPIFKIMSTVYGNANDVEGQDIFINRICCDGWSFLESVPLFANQIVLRFVKQVEDNQS